MFPVRNYDEMLVSFFDNDDMKKIPCYDISISQRICKTSFEYFSLGIELKSTLNNWPFLIDLFFLVISRAKLKFGRLNGGIFRTITKLRKQFE